MAANKDKSIFFQELDKLDYLTDDPQDQEYEDFAHLLSASRKVFNTNPSISSVDGPPPMISRANTAPSQSSSLQKSGAALTEEVIVIDDSSSSNPTQGFIRPTVRKSHTVGATPDKNEMPVSKKRRLNSFKTIPEQQQIFKGLKFFFFPNNDKSPLRRVRIQRAQEYGAFWAKAWDDHVTHVIVDKDLTWDVLVKFLKLESFPPNVALVNETYPGECIKFRSVLSPTHIRFHVNGAPAATRTEDPAPSIEQSSTKSLPLKPPRKRQPSLTPSQVIESESETTSVPIVKAVDEIAKNVPEEAAVSNPHPSRERDALDDVIEAAKAAKDLPLDSDDSDDQAVPDELDSEPSQSSQSSEPEPDRRQRKQSLRKEQEERGSWQQRFVCMQRHDQGSSSDNPNVRTIEVLQQMLNYYDTTSDHWRVIVYRKAISALRKEPKKISTRTQALSIPGIGQRLADKIEEIVLTNRLRRLENTNNTAEDLIFQEFLGVYGAGVSQASKWVAQGFKTLEDLKTKASLTKNQRIGVERYHDFAQRILRQEVEAHGDIVRRAVQKVDPEMQVIIGGSYRRGAPDSGDIDCLITKPNATIEQIRSIMMDSVVPKLFKQGFLQASLASSSRVDGSKWHGASALPGSNLWRRIDLLFVPGAEIGAALIYFTGNDIFNRSMRLLASKKGMCLNQRGLYKDVQRGAQRVKFNRGVLVESRDEKRIFEVLGVPWRPPEHRIC